MKIYHGTIISCDESDNIHSYLVEDKGRILFIGDSLPDRYNKESIIELGKKALIPSFADTHLHFSSFALFHSGINVSSARSNKEIIEQLRSYHVSNEKIIVGFGLSPHSVEEGKMISRVELDSVSLNLPVFLVKYDGHACVVNSELLKILPTEISEMRGFNAERGEMGQDAFFAVTDFVTNSISPILLIKNMIRAYDYMSKQGLGMFHTVSGVGFPGDLDVDLERWLARGIGSGIQTRLFFQTMDIPKVLKRKLPRIGGCFATALDGCFGSVDAALLAPYEGTDNRGVLYYSDDEIFDFCRKANRADLQIEVHAIGDAAFDQASRALDSALKDYPRKDHRHGIIHACLPTERGIDICAEQGIQLPMQPAFLNWPQEPSSYLRSILGEREAKLNPLSSLWKRGILLSGGSDAPCTTPDPISGIHWACNHPVPEEALTPLQALKMFTINGYKSSFDEKERGSLEEGKIADMVLLSGNPLEIGISDLKNLEVEETIYGGKPYRDRSPGALSSIGKGLISRSSI
ncbi:MAG: amidohydrolase family protein [Spirochaetales bacterium]|nr:amidohydrolase family protein [Spirochaetales bacterium]